MARMQAIVPHTTGTNRTLLRFEPGDVIRVLMPEAQNGWLYGKLEGSSTYVPALGLQMGAVSLKSPPSFPPAVVWAPRLTHHHHLSHGLLLARRLPKLRRCGEAGLAWMSCLPEKVPGHLGGRAMDAVTPSQLAQLSDSCHRTQLRAMNC